MRKLEELGITESPWRFTGYTYHKDGMYIHLGEVSSINGHKLAYDLKAPDARMFAAAPLLYAALREAVIQKCSKCICKRISDFYCDHKDCAWYKWREALIAASGHETACEI